ncbi:MAG: preprotein translocase subunit SecE [Bdellovibrionaceae bacterium]|nr:preprotein translocase subunit SecE [Pseudobdellovibrionaceae bacterium]
MDKTNQKILTVAFATAGAIFGLTLSLLITALSGIFGWMANLAGQDWFRHGLPVAAGFGLFLFLQFSPKMLQWGDEVVSELRKVVWPSRKDVTAMTIVVCIMVVVSSLVISSFDFVSGYVLNNIILQ